VGGVGKKEESEEKEKISSHLDQNWTDLLGRRIKKGQNICI
jgi:hypothetical protein